MTTPVSAQDLKEEGLRLFQEGLHEEAGARFAQAREQFAASGDEIDAAEMTNNLGLVYRMQRRMPEALSALEGARTEFARLGDRSREAQALGNLGGLYATMHERDKAASYLRQAADIFKELGDTQREGETLLALGAQKWKTGERSAGLATYEVGLESLRKPTFGQKVLRGLLALRAKVIGR